MIPETKNTLTIATDAVSTSWLQYLLKEFQTIHGAAFDLEVVNVEKSDQNSRKCMIFYIRDFDPNAKVSLVNKSHVSPKGSGAIEYVDPELYVLPGTMDVRFTLTYDLFWNAFVFLSRLEEYQSYQSGKNTLSHCILHPRQNKRSLTIPIVNLLFNELEKLIRNHFPDLPFRSTPAPQIELSHDVDYLSKTPQLIVKQTILNTYDTFRFLFPWKHTIQRIKKSVEFLFSRPSYWCFEYWENLEKSFQYRSTFYVHAKAQAKNFGTWIIDPNYDVLKNPTLQNKLRSLVSDGFEVGVHGSFLAAVDEGLLKKEKEILEGIINRPIVKGRQHWLRFNEGITPYIHNNILKYDSTLGWNDRVGFRNGCASLFHPYDHKNQKAFDYIEIPQVIMDFNIYESLGFENISFVEESLRILDAIKACKSAHVAISWHQQVCNSDYDWHKSYEVILSKWAKDHRATKLQAVADV